MTTSPGLGVIPDAGRAEVGTPVCSTRLLIREDLDQGVRSIVVLYYFTIELTRVYGRIQQVGGAAPEPVVAPIYQFLIGLAGSVEVLILALLSTMILVFATRRASLRQINASLLDVTEKLTRLEDRFLKQ
jgi:hypothetical protein